MKKIDSGNIYFVKKFKIKKNYELNDLINKTYEEMFKLFKNKIKILLFNKRLIINKKIKWNKKNYSTRNDIEKLSIIKFEMSKNEIFRRIRSTYLKNKFYPKIFFFGKLYKIIED